MDLPVYAQSCASKIWWSPTSIASVLCATCLIYICFELQTTSGRLAEETCSFVLVGPIVQNSLVSASVVGEYLASKSRAICMKLGVYCAPDMWPFPKKLWGTNTGDLKLALELVLHDPIRFLLFFLFGSGVAAMNSVWGQSFMCQACSSQVMFALLCCETI